MPYFYPELRFTTLLALISCIPSGLFSIAMYVLTALSLYTIATRRGIRKAWLAWVPVLNCWILGSLSDQYRYVVRGQIKNKRKILLILNLLKAVLTTTLVSMAAVVIWTMFTEATGFFMGSVLSLLGLLLPLGAVYLAYCIFYYMALYDLYASVDPENHVLFLVLSIFFSVTKSFFLFFSREKDNGMPPRREM